MNFKVIVPVYNSEMWISKCINSIVKQEYDDWKAIIIEDNSTDGTLEQIKNVLGKCPLKHKFRVCHRTSNVGALENIVYGINQICEDDNEVIVLLDGDDWLYDDSVFSHLNDVYKEDVWVTYGSFTSNSGMHDGFCKPINDLENYRKLPWVSSHLRTFKYGLWKHVKDEDLRDVSGRYYSMAWDMCIMYPLLEMAGLERMKFIDKTLYVYNDDNPNNDFRKSVINQITCANEIKNKQRYRRIENFSCL